MNVLIVGLPRSGNRLLARLLKHHGVNVLGVRHFGSGFRSPPNIDLAIIPVRDSEINWKSMEKAQLGLTLSDRDRIQTMEEMHFKHFAPTLRGLHCTPTIPICYEDLVADPEFTGQFIIEACGLEWKGWPERVVDGNAPYLRGNN